MDPIWGRVDPISSHTYPIPSHIIPHSSHPTLIPPHSAHPTLNLLSPPRPFQAIEFVESTVEKAEAGERDDQEIEWLANIKTHLAAIKSRAAEVRASVGCGIVISRPRMHSSPSHQLHAAPHTTLIWQLDPPTNVSQSPHALTLVWQVLHALTLVWQVLHALTLIWQVLHALTLIWQVLNALAEFRENSTTGTNSCTP